MLNRGEREDFDPRRFEAASRRELLPAGGAGGGGGEKYAFGRRGARDDEMDTDPRMRLRWAMSRYKVMFDVTKEILLCCVLYHIHERYLLMRF